VPIALRGLTVDRETGDVHAWWQVPDLFVDLASQVETDHEVDRFDVADVEGTA
jgi:hypothetical protein